MAMASNSTIANTSSSTTTATCLPPPPMKAVSNGLLQGDIPLDFALPLLIVQIAVVLLVTRTLACMFRRIRQPRVLAEIIGGVLLGPTALGRNTAFRNAIFPARSLPLLETVATMGLMFFIFIVGLQLDLSALRRSGKSALLIAVSGIAAPFAASSALAPIVLRSSAASPPPRLVPLLVFMGTPLSISAFSVLVRVMAELGMLSTDVAKLAVPSAAVNDVSVWTLLAVGVAIAGPNSNPLVPLWVLLCGLALGLALLAFGRGFMGAVARRAVRQSSATDLYVCVTLTAVLLAGFASDAIGVHPLLGPFLLGMFMPKDNDFPAMIVDKTEDFVTGLMLPLFFASSGLKTNLSSLRGPSSLGFLALFFAAAAFGKIAATFVSARLCGLPTRRALVLGFLMNTKGLAVLIVLNVGRDLHALTDELFAILVLTCLLTSFLTFPIVSALWGAKGDVDSTTGNDGIDAEQSSSRASSTTAHAANSVQAVENDSRRQLRLLAALSGSDGRHYDYVYTAAAALVDVVEAARGSSCSSGKKKGSPLKLYTLWLEQMSDRRSGILRLLYGTNDLAATYFGRGAVDARQQKCWKPAERSAPRTQSSSAAVFVPSFQPSESLSKVQVRSMTAVSELDEEHRAIAIAAARKQAALIILPWLLKKKKEGFHGSSVDDGEPNHLPRSYQHLLDHQQSPCSVAILVVIAATAADGESTATIRPSCCSYQLPYKVVLLFSGGADDREALSLACRMAEHPSVRLRVIRLIVTGTAKLSDPSQAEDDDDQEAIAKLKQKATDKERCGAAMVQYEEEEVVEVEAGVKRMAADLMREANLVMVGHRNSRADADGAAAEGGGAGRRRRRLGLIGDMLVSTSGGGGGGEDEECRASILVIHQHDSAAASTTRKI